MNIPRLRVDCQIIDWKIKSKLDFVVNEEISLSWVMNEQKLIITLSECLVVKDLQTESQPRVHNGSFVDNIFSIKNSLNAGIFLRIGRTRCAVGVGVVGNLIF